MSKTSIEWTSETWNPVRGCSRVSPGCVNCYAERMAARDLPGMKSPTTGEPFAHQTPSGPRWTGKVELIPHMLDVPLRRRQPTTYFVNSMSDLFHENLPDRDILSVFKVMKDCPHHTLQILTKRSKNMRRVMTEMYGKIAAHVGPWPLPNVWLGVSVEDQEYADKRIPDLLATPAAVRFVSYEPALGPVDFREFLPVETIGGVEMERWLDWIIVGGESGPGARPFDIGWARSVIQQCKAAGVAVFVKQLGAKPVGDNLLLNDLKGGDIEEWPSDLRVREMPEAAVCTGL